ncbi:Domain of unknown function DUF304 [Burkholderiaceae bacterium]|jgi:hypothetical protein
MSSLYQSPEHEFEPSYGLPEALPAGEHILWQGSPNWFSLTRHAFHLFALMAYFGLIITAKLISISLAETTWFAELGSIALVIALSILGMVLIACLAYWSATTTVYTLTTSRVVMRVGIVLTVSFNLPLKRIVSADVHQFSDGTGNIRLKLAASDKIAYFHLWPHARPWYFAHPEPMLRSIPQATVVAKQLTTAWQAANLNQTTDDLKTPNNLAPLQVAEQAA